MHNGEVGECLCHRGVHIRIRYFTIFIPRCKKKSAHYDPVSSQYTIRDKSSNGEVGDCLYQEQCSSVKCALCSVYFPRKRNRRD